MDNKVVSKPLVNSSLQIKHKLIDNEGNEWLNMGEATDGFVQINSDTGEIRVLREWMVIYRGDTIH